MPSLRLDTACFASILFETFFFGFYTLLFVVAVRLLLVRGRVRIPWHITVPTLLLYVFAAAHVLTTIKHGSVGFIQIASQGQVDGAIKYFATTVNATNIVNHCLYVINNFLGDSIIIWRCYIVWGRNWKVVALPLLLLCTSMASGFVVAYNFSRSTDGPFSTKLNIAANMFFGSIFTTNCIVTSLTALKIWKYRKIAREAGASHDHTGTLNIVVESGAVYSIILAVEMLLYALGANFVFVLYTSMAQITGIAPTAIIVLVLLGRTLRHSSPTDHTLPSLRATHPSGLADGRTSNRSLAPPRGNGRGLSSTLDLESRLDNAQPIRIDIKTSTEVSPHETLDTELDSLPQKVSRERQDLTTWK